jgi:hypothetical protein
MFLGYDTYYAEPIFRRGSAASQTEISENVLLFSGAFMNRALWIMPVLLSTTALTMLRGADDVFSGPQVNEKLHAFKVRGVLDDNAGKEIDFVTQAGDKPIVLVFVHDVNRQSISVVRVLSSYTVSRAKDGLATGVVWLDADPTEAEATLERIKHALTPKAPTGISLDGREGPGSYGLNRNVQLTVLVGKEGKVTANFALVQPSLQADVPKMLEAIVKVAGGKVPKLEEIAGMPAMARPAAGAPQQDPNLRGLISPVIRRDARPEDVDAAAKKLEEYVAKNEATKKEVGRIANTIINAGKLKDYGTERAQEYLQKWAKEYGGEAPQRKPEAEPKPERGENK